MAEDKQERTQLLYEWVVLMRQTIKTTPDQELPEVQGFMAGATCVLTLLEDDYRSGRVRAP